MAKRICSVVENDARCSRPVYCRGWCRRHYSRWHKTGQVRLTRQGTPEQRFWRHVDSDGLVEPERWLGHGPCWIWTGSLDPKGYGRFDRRLVHRWAYEHFVGPIPVDFDVDHLCFVRACCNPAHLEAVTHRENVLRARGIQSGANAEPMHCRNGHLYTEATIYIHPQRGTFDCKLCHRERDRRQAQSRRDSLLS